MVDFWTLMVALAALAASLISLWVTLRRQKLEAVRQRQIAAASQIMSATYNMIRFSSVGGEKFRDSESLLEIAIRTLALDTLDTNKAFVEELMEWMHRLRNNSLDFQSPGVEYVPDNLVADAISDLRERGSAFVSLLSEWVAASRGERNEVELEMKRERLSLWPDNSLDMRTWPR